MGSQHTERDDSSTGAAMAILTNIVSALTLMTVGLTGCATVTSDRQFSASEPSSQTACERPVHEHSYVATCVSTASRQPDTPIRDTPYSAQIITRQLIEDQRALTVGDALRNVSGVQGSR